MSEVIELNDVHKSFGTQQVLKSVSLRIESGRFYVLLGQNGSGKSTLMRVLMNLEPMNRGSGHIFSRPITEDPAPINQDVAYVSEALDLLVPGNIKSFISFYSTFYPRWDQNVFLAAISKLGVPIQRHFRQLSRGQRMQVAFAMALAIRPKLFLLDEITSVLDANARGWVMNRLKEEVQAGASVVMATNIVTELHSFADHMLLIEDGKIELQMPIADLSTTFQKLKVPAGTPAAQIADLGAIPVGIDSEDLSLICLLPKGRSANARPTQQWLDKRSVTAEEAFVYYMRKRAA